MSREPRVVIESTPYQIGVYDGPPPARVQSADPPGPNNNYGGGRRIWECECGQTGISSSPQWAHSDVNRHRLREHDAAETS